MADHLVPKSSKLYEAAPDETIESNTILKNSVLEIFFNGAERMGQTGKIIAGAGVVFISPKGKVLSYTYSLTKTCSNNVAEYNAIIIVLQIAEEIGVKY